MHSGQKSTLYDEKVNKRVKNRRNSFKNWSKNRFFVKTTYSQCAGNHSEHAIRSGMKFSLIWDPRTAIWGKIGGFRFKSPHREQMLLLLLNLEGKTTMYLQIQNWNRVEIPYSTIFFPVFLLNSTILIFSQECILLNIREHPCVT